MKVGDDRVDGDAPARDRDRPSGRSGRTRDCEAARARLEVELERDRLLADRAVRADGEHGLGREPEVLAGRHVEVRRRPAQVAELDAVARSASAASSGSSGDELVQAALDVEAGCDAVLQQVAPRRREAPALRRDADERRRRARRQRFRDRADDRDAVRRLARPRRVEHGDRRMRAVVEDARAVFP